MDNLNEFIEFELAKLKIKFLKTNDKYALDSHVISELIK